MFSTYSPSGRFGVSTIFYLFLGLGIAIGLSFVYQLGLYWIPLIYVNALLTAAFGYALGMIGSFAVNRGHCRNIVLAAVIATLLVVGGLGGKFFFQYQHLLRAGTDAMVEDIAQQLGIPKQQLLEEKPELLEAIKEQHPSFIEHIQMRVENGFNIGRRGGQGAPVADLFVYLVWLVEAGIVVYFAMRPPIEMAGQPYSEPMNQWADEVKSVMLLPISEPAMVDQIKSATDVDALLEIPIPKTDQSHQFANYIVNSIAGEEMEDAYLSVDLLTLSLNREGETETKTEPLVKHAILSSEQRHQLVENAELLNEAMEDYRRAVAEEEIEARTAAVEQEAAESGDGPEDESNPMEEPG